MKEEIKLIYDANHVYREGYDQAVHDMKEDRIAAQTEAVGTFIEQIGHMAEENWTPQQVLMLEWLIGATLHDVDYAEYAELQMINEKG